MPVDDDSDYYAHTKQAIANRQAKAKAIARHLYDQGVSAETARSLPEDERRAVVRAVDYASASELTWAAVFGLLEQRAEWDAAHPPEPSQDDAEPAPPNGACEEPCIYAYRGCTGTGRARGGHAPRCAQHDIHRGVYLQPDPDRTLDALLARATAARNTKRPHPAAVAYA